MRNICTIKDCGKFVKGHGLCDKHWRRNYIHGSPYILKIRPKGTGSFDHGYKMIYKNGKQVREHRYLIEKHLGRKLTKKETIHHIDGNKLNNKIDNLEIVSRSEHSKKHVKYFRNETHKQCSCCKKILLRELFSKNNADINRDPNDTRCKKCKVILNRKY